MSTDTDRIRALNDQLRRHLTGGKAVMTPGVAALGSEAVQRLVQAIAIFDDFSALPTIRTANMTLARSSSKAHPSCLKLTTTIRT